MIVYNVCSYILYKNEYVIMNMTYNKKGGAFYRNTTIDILLYLVPAYLYLRPKAAKEKKKEKTFYYL